MRSRASGGARLRRAGWCAAHVWLALVLAACWRRPPPPEPERDVSDDPLPELTPQRADPVVSALESALAWANALEAQPDPVRRAVECAQKVGLVGKPLRDCHARACGDAGAVLIDATGECGGDSCAGYAYALSADGRATPLPFAGHKACAPDGSFVVVDVAQPPKDASHDPRRSSVVLHKYPTGGEPVAPFADCMSPQLTPDGSAFLCRNRQGDVLMVGKEGGATRLVAKAGVPASKVKYHPETDRYPAPPTIVNGILRFSLDLQSGPVERELLWPTAELTGAKHDAP